MKISIAKHIILGITLLLVPIIAQADETVSYSYDDAGRLIRAQYGDAAANTKVIDYSYDEVGNRTQKGTGIAEISTDPASVNFGNVFLRQTSDPVTVTVTNTGTADLSIGQLQIIGANASEFSLPGDTCSNQTLIPSATCTFDADFSPAIVGSRTASVEIPYIDPGTPEVHVALNGSAREWYLIAVNKAGTGNGLVVSDLFIGDPADEELLIDCGTRCSSVLMDNDVVTLTVTPDPESSFIGWSVPGCTGTTCTITITDDTTVTATFEFNPASIPSNLSANAVSPNQIDLTWTDNSNAGTGFVIERKGGADVDFVVIEPDCPNTSYSDTGLAPATEYTYQVRVIVNGFASPPSNQAIATTPPNQTADFSATQLNTLAPSYVSFNDLSTGIITTWLWDFGDGATSAEQNPVHTYATAGTYTVSLTVSDGVTSDTMTKTDYISVQSCANQPVRIDGATPVYYSSLQAAYDAAADGDVIQVQAVELIEDLNAQIAVSVTIDGGYDCDYTSKIGRTVLKGNIHTTDGTVTTRDIHLAQ